MIPGGKLYAFVARSKLGSFLGKIGASVWNSAKHYAQYATRLIRGGVVGGGLWIVETAAGFLRRGCTCFEAGTQIETDRGTKPIEDIRVGDLVWAQDTTTGEQSLRRVYRTHVRLGAPIVAIDVLLDNGQVETLRTTEEHPFFVDGAGWLEAHGVAPGMRIRTQGGVAEVVTLAFTGERRTVYNFEVEGLHTYFVGSDRVVVHNGKPDCLHDLPAFITRNFTNPRKIEYHWEKHAERFGKSLEDYMNDALSFFDANRHRGIPWQTEVGTGIKIPGQPGGIFSQDGRIITFWYD